MSTGVYIPSDFLESLRTHVPGFSQESERNQWGLALMAWERSQKRRQHRSEPGALSFSEKELASLFGRDKHAPMLRTAFANWSSNWSHRDGTTRAYRLSIEVREALEAYAAGPAAGSATLLTLTGTRLKAPKRLLSAVSSTGTNGKPTRTADWDCAKHMNSVPVNGQMLEALRQWLSDHLTSSLIIDRELELILRRLLDTVVKVIKTSLASLAGTGHLPQVYAIAPTGRLYARGLNLQNAPSLIKDAALHGFWEYDLANCHFTIVAELAAERGTPCPAIQHYLLNKKAVRQQIADEAEITVEQAKKCMLAMLYGARTATWFKTAIPSTIGIEAAKRLYAVAEFQSLAAELDVASSAILATWPRTANGSLTNASGKAIRGDASAARKLAHIVQGVEARALRAIVSKHPDNIVLLQHDGFVSRVQLDRVALEEEVLSVVGYRLSVEEKQIELHTDAASLINRTESEIALEAVSSLTSDPFAAD